MAAINFTLELSILQHLRWGILWFGCIDQVRIRAWKRKGWFVYWRILRQLWWRYVRPCQDGVGFSVDWKFVRRDEFVGECNTRGIRTGKATPHFLSQRIDAKSHDQKIPSTLQAKPNARRNPLEGLALSARDGLNGAEKAVSRRGPWCVGEEGVWMLSVKDWKPCRQRASARGY